ncbi:IclR family transcriptional regulator [Paramicrobacterium agarici]|uniref:IclR family transcriptional regulator n=1 Tax=Paramicrobacterium agarici TaxID=630514 RepID=A0A2A9DUW4_9MICO|nr:IclR family transcriptional regulator [Microbacterium agarici]PFG29945.1 IclR family transcriptional regulator [Microbacterium agarici]
MGVALNEEGLALSGSPKPSYMGRILDVLELAVISDDAPLTMTEISERARVPISTTSRLIKNLEEWDFLVQDGHGKYLPGGRVVRMAVVVSAQLHTPQRIEAATTRITQATGESVTGGLIIGDRVVIVARTESEHPLRAVHRVGEQVSPTASALGKAILSRSSEQRKRELAAAWERDDDSPSLEELDSELQQALEDGYTKDEETFAPGLRCRAVPIIGQDGMAVGAVSVAGPAARFRPEIADEAAQLLMNEASALSSLPTDHVVTFSREVSHVD